MLRRGPNETPLMFKDRFKKALNAMEQLGEDMAGITLLQAYLAPRHITNLDRARHATLLVELDNVI